MRIAYLTQQLQLTSFISIVSQILIIQFWYSSDLRIVNVKEMYIFIEIFYYTIYHCIASSIYWTLGNFSFRASIVPGQMSSSHVWLYVFRKLLLEQNLYQESFLILSFSSIQCPIAVSTTGSQKLILLKSLIIAFWNKIYIFIWHV